MNFFKLGAMTAAFIASAPVEAATFAYSLTGDYSANWVLNSNPATFNVQIGQIFRVADALGTFQDIAGPGATLIFYSSSEFGGIGIEGDRLVLDTTGPQLYSGPESSPTMLTGRFLLMNETGRLAYTLTVSDLSAVPEVGTWSMMIIGFGLAGVSVRRQKRTMPALRA